MIDFIIFGKDLTALGVIDVQNSVMWERRYYEAGYFEIHVPPNDNNNELLKTGRYIFRTDAKESGVILYINKNTDAYGTSDITVIGRFLSYLLRGHVIRAIRTYQGNAESIMRDLVFGTCMQVGNPNYIENLELGKLCGATENVTIHVEYGDLHATLKEIARLSGVAFRIYLEPETKIMKFECYKGTDHRANQYDNPQVIFSSELDTIIGEVGCTEDDSVTVNAVTMVYSGELGTLVTRYSPVNAKGVDLHEIGIVTDKCVSGTGESGPYLIRDETETLLLNMALDEIVKKTSKTYASVVSSGTYEYRKDYDIGDIVTIQHKPFGISETKRIHKIIESYSEMGIETVPEFGEIAPKEIE